MLNRIRADLSIQVLIGMCLGIVAGVLMGERMLLISFIGDIFLVLLQMTVLPYIIVSLVSSIGALTGARAAALGRVGVQVLLLLWLIVLAIIAVASLAFPDWPSASYFNPAMLEATRDESVLVGLLPKNIFASLSDGAVPAVVLFSTFFGVALINLANKGPVLELVKALQAAIGGIGAMVMRTAPLGVFAIAASAAGSLDWESIQALYIMLISYVLVCMVLAFWILPMLVKTLTPLRYSEILHAMRVAMITAFATGNLFIVLPLILKSAEDLIAKIDNDKSSEGLVEVVVPVAFAVPVAGKLLALLFVLFAGWFSGEEIHFFDYPGLFLVGVLKLFGSTFMAVPELLHAYHIPPEMFGLYPIAENTFSNRLGSLVSTVFIVTLAVLAAYGTAHQWSTKVRQVARFIVIGAVLAGVVALALRVLTNYVDYQYTGYTEFIERDLLFPRHHSRVLRELPEVLPTEPEGPVLQRIQNRQLLRVGYFRDWLPFAFHNQQGDLVGLDVELALRLGKDLGVPVEFVRVYRNDLKRLLDRGYLDLATSVAMSPYSVSLYTLSRSHSEENLALLLRNEHRRFARTWREVIDNENARLGVLSTYFVTSAVRSAPPHMSLTEIESPREFLRGDNTDINAVVMGASGASAWTLLHPEFAVVVPQPVLIPVPMALPVASNDFKFLTYVNQWIEMKRLNGTIGQLDAYWLRGEKNRLNKPRRWNLWDALVGDKEPAGN